MRAVASPSCSPMAADSTTSRSASSAWRRLPSASRARRRGPARRERTDGGVGRLARGRDRQCPARLPLGGAGGTGRGRAQPVHGSAGPPAGRRARPEDRGHPRPRCPRARRHGFDGGRLLGGGPAPHGERDHARWSVPRRGQCAAGCDPLDPRRHEQLRRGPGPVLRRPRRLDNPQRQEHPAGVVHLHAARPLPRLGTGHHVAVRAGVHPEPAERRDGRPDRPEQAVRVRRAAGALARASAAVARLRRSPHLDPARGQSRFRLPVPRARRGERRARAGPWASRTSARPTTPSRSCGSIGRSRRPKRSRCGSTGGGTRSNPPA